MLPEIGYTFETKAVAKYTEKQDKFYIKFDIDPEHKSYYGVGDNDKIVDVKCEVIDVDLLLDNLYSDKSYDSNCVDYLAYFYCDSERKLIQPNIKVFNCCFPYGADAMCFDKNGKRIGSICRLKVEELQ
ncbi:MAG: hypothetical protein IKO56_00805 [Alphaproteobacteria bacterium]|nr:hypothetical protein [Alphaproteobacteria bacterium]